MARWLEDLEAMIYEEGERAPRHARYELVDENGSRQDLFAAVELEEGSVFPEVPQEGLYYLLAQASPGR